MELSIKDLRPISNTKVISSDILSPLWYAKCGVPSAILNKDDSKLVIGALFLEQSDVLINTKTQACYFILNRDGNVNVFEFDEKHLQQIDLNKCTLGIKFHGEYFFEKKADDIRTSDDGDLVKYARFSLKAVDLISAVFLLQENQMLKAASISCSLEVNDSYGGKINSSEISVRRFKNHLQTDVAFESWNMTSFAIFNVKFHISQAVGWTEEGKSHDFNYPEVSMEVNEHGALVIKAGYTGFDESDFLSEILNDAKIKHKDHDFIAALLDENIRAGGSSFFVVQPEWIGALTDSPIVTDEQPAYEDDGSVTFTDSANFWWYPDYQIKSFADELIEGGKTIFNSAPKAG